MVLRTIFDASQNGHDFSWLGTLPFSVIGYLILFKPELLSGWKSGKGRLRKALGWILMIFPVLFSFITFFSTYYTNVKINKAIADHNYNEIAGIVTMFSPMPFSGKVAETFCIGEKCFHYSDNLITGGFNRASINGGPMRLGIYAKVKYIDNLIIGLEVAEQ